MTVQIIGEDALNVMPLEAPPEQIPAQPEEGQPPSPPAAESPPPPPPGRDLFGNSDTPVESIGELPDDPQLLAAMLNDVGDSPDEAGEPLDAEPLPEEAPVLEKMDVAPPSVEVPGLIPPPEKKAEKKPDKPANPQPNRTDLTPQQMMRQAMARDSRRLMGSRSGQTVSVEISRYYNTIARLIMQQGLDKKYPPHLEVVYTLTIEPNGRVSGLTMLASSGNREFDQAIAKAIRNASPLPPLPPAFGGRSDKASFTFYPTARR